MDAESHATNEDIELIRRHFDPLAERLGLRGPRIMDFNLEFVVAYLGSTLGLEIQVARADFFPYLCVFRHVGEVIPLDYQDGEGRTVKLSLLQAARRTRGDLQVHERLRALAGRREKAAEMLELAVRAAEELWPALRLQEATLFDDGRSARA
jgi:hypothetical protein